MAALPVVLVPLTLAVTVLFGPHLFCIASVILTPALTVFVSPPSLAALFAATADALFVPLAGLWTHARLSPLLISPLTLIEQEATKPATPSYLLDFSCS